MKLSIFNTKNKKVFHYSLLLQHSNNKFHNSFSKADKQCNVINYFKYVTVTFFKKNTNLILSIFFNEQSNSIPELY